MIYFKFKDDSYIKKTNHVKNTIFIEKCCTWLLKFLIPQANPDFDDKISNVAKWYLEFNDDLNVVWREIGLNINNEVIVKMPDEKNYGFWSDANLKIEDFAKQFNLQKISEEEFNNLWNSVYYDREKKIFVAS